MSIDHSRAVGDRSGGDPSNNVPPRLVSAGLQNMALAAMLGLVAWLTFAQTRALQEAHQLVAESQAAAERADRICRQSAMITIAVRELRDEFVRRQQEMPLDDDSFAMNELPESGD
ncbi:MAG TPA: hypothetical protein VN699_18900 [Pirellulales bacterium]|nr:hypothetical protein [Pirellulales bacterium]